VVGKGGKVPPLFVFFTESIPEKVLEGVDDLLYQLGKQGKEPIIYALKTLETFTGQIIGKAMGKEVKSMSWNY
jgi:predicted fused transcriptional regulator/phosphomethylpyrimidine kinase